MRAIRSIPAILALLLAAGCSEGGKPRDTAMTGDAPAPASAPVSGAPGAGSGFLAIEPGEVYRGTVVRLATGGVPPGGVPIEWLVNGSTVGPTLDSHQLRKGDTIQARAVAGDKVAASAIVTVRNTIPEIRRAGFVQPDHRTGRPLSVDAEGYDADGDPVRIEIVWQKNGKAVGTGDHLDVPVRQGDKIIVTLTPFDGESYGKAAALTREVRNTVLIEGKEDLQASGNVVTFRILASSDSGTPLTYSLKQAPPGMRIDPATGRVRWETDPGTTGKVPFDVTVSDGAGAETTARFTLTVREDDASGPR